MRINYGQKMNLAFSVKWLFLRYYFGNAESFYKRKQRNQDCSLQVKSKSLIYCCKAKYFSEHFYISILPLQNYTISFPFIGNEIFNWQQFQCQKLKLYMKNSKNHRVQKQPKCHPLPSQIKIEKTWLLLSWKNWKKKFNKVKKEQGNF